MLVDKEVISPGVYYYRDEATGEPRKLVVTPELTKHWHDQGNKMIGLGLTVPVPCEHDFTAHPMTPADKLKGNAGWVNGYELRGDSLWSKVDVQDEELAKKLPRTIRWTSPWISSFTDGEGRAWNNVISHLALTTRPRIIKQQPFSGIAAALSAATEARVEDVGKGGFCLSRAGLLVEDESKQLQPRYPMAFSMVEGVLLSKDSPHDKATGHFTGTGHASDNPKSVAAHKDRERRRRRRTKGKLLRRDPDHSDEEHAARVKRLQAGGYVDKHGRVTLAVGDAPPTKKKFPPDADAPLAKGAKPPLKAAADELPDDDLDDDLDGDEGDDLDLGGLMDPTKDSNGDIKMEELLCDLLQALGVPMPDESNETEFKRHLYEAAMSKIKELTSKGMGGTPPPDQNKPPAQQPNAAKPNPIMPQVKQEQPPVYMGLSGGATVAAVLSLEDINKIEDSTMRTVALSMYNQNQELLAKLEATERTTNAMRDAKLVEETKKRATRIQMLGRLSPKVREDLEAMVGLQSMALSLGDGGQVVDPMRATLDMLEKGLSDLPRLLTADHSTFSVVPHPTDADALSQEGEDKLVEDMARMMGCAPEKKVG